MLRRQVIVGRRTGTLTLFPHVAGTYGSEMSRVGPVLRPRHEARGLLAHYGEQLDSVEADSTCYPPPVTTSSSAGQT